ncbi:hypothetical protein KFL_002010050 [Klebsormidium nitens]|uniref:Uncharacterized protein n=1 Tax=Klebsormidium nitens TaxID=105231 RepID=A0A0U9HK37_KLENI|nr:hypothetical protein KFL_002010050 [Klebsormidium nitens]|eukprot:GAQ84689.1 hypothetical protein KFL_002010050 [Klebsormidium nitens]
MLKLLRTKKAGATCGGVLPHYVLHLNGVEWLECPLDLFKECFENTPLQDDLDDASICPSCHMVEETHECSFCQEVLGPEGVCWWKTKLCGACQGVGCEEHFDGQGPPCFHGLCQDCSNKLPLTCGECGAQVCPQCDASRHEPCVYCEKPVCDRCRFFNTLCPCKYEEMTLDEFRSKDFQAICTSCLDEEPQESELPQERSSSARSKNKDNVPSPLCIPCLLKTYNGDNQTDERSVVMGLRILGDKVKELSRLLTL